MKCLVSTRGRSEGLRDPISLPGTGQTDTLLLHYVLSVLQCHPFGCVLSVCNVFRFSRFAKRCKRNGPTNASVRASLRGSYTGVCGSVPFAAFGIFDIFCLTPGTVETVTFFRPFAPFAAFLAWEKGLTQQTLRIWSLLQSSQRLLRLGGRGWGQSNTIS